MLAISACTLSQSPPRTVIVTATSGGVSSTVPTSLPPTLPAVLPTPDPTRHGVDNALLPQEHVVQPGDTLLGIALLYGTTLDTLLAANELDNPNQLEVGQMIRLPDIPTERTSALKIIPDSRLVRAPGSSSFDVSQFIQRQPGYIRAASDEVVSRLADGSEIRKVLSAADVIQRVSIEYSMDARLLLALLEYRAGWLSQTSVRESLQTHPLLSETDSQGFDRAGLYSQLAWAADQLNRGYYGWRYRSWTTLEFSDTTRLLISDILNAGTVGVQYFFSLHNTVNNWQRDVSEVGLYATYARLFGDPFASSVEPLVPSGLVQPEFTLPFQSDETWFYTGGWHGGWGSGSAWAAVDFAPPDVSPDRGACYTSDYAVRAIAPGQIVRSENGAVVLDLDADGDETTGWTILYLHIASQRRVRADTTVQVGDPIGYAACEGGFSTATHLHIARRYNGEWIPADCVRCPVGNLRPSFTMSGWRVRGIVNQEYQGFLEKGPELRRAEQGRLNPINRISW